MNNSNEGAGTRPEQRPVTIYTTATCPYCIMAKRLLATRGIVFTEIPVGGNPDLRREMQEKSGGYTVPQIFIGDQPIGGSDDLHAMDARGTLKDLLVAG